MRKHDESVSDLRRSLEFTRKEESECFLEMHKHVENGTIGDFYKEEMVQIFGDDWESELNRLRHREKMNLEYNNLYLWLTRIALARRGKCRTNMLLNFDGFGPTRHNLMAAKCVEDNLRKSGLDVRLEIVKVNNTSYYARVANLEYHGGFGSPVYMWRDVVDVKQSNQHQRT